MRFKRFLIAKPDEKSGFFVVCVNVLLAALLLCALFWAAIAALGLTLKFVLC